MDGDAAPRRKPGRPRVRDEPGLPAQYVGFRASFKLKEQLAKAAAASGRSLSTEAQFRLEQSFSDDAFFPAPLRHEGRRLLGSYLVQGVAGAVRHLTTKMPDPATLEPPDEAERRRRWQEMRDTLDQARWASTEAEERYQRVQRKVEEFRAMLLAQAEAEAAANPEDEAA